MSRGRGVSRVSPHHRRLLPVPEVIKSRTGLTGNVSDSRPVHTSSLPPRERDESMVSTLSTRWKLDPVTLMTPGLVDKDLVSRVQVTTLFVQYFLFPMSTCTRQRMGRGFRYHGVTFLYGNRGRSRNRVSKTGPLLRPVFCLKS